MKPAPSSAACGAGLCAAGVPVIKLMNCLIDITVFKGTG